MRASNAIKLQRPFSLLVVYMDDTVLTRILKRQLF